MMKENTFFGKLMAMIMIVGILVTMSVITKTLYANHVIDETNKKYAYMQTEEYKEYQAYLNEKYTR